MTRSDTAVRTVRPVPRARRVRHLRSLGVLLLAMAMAWGLSARFEMSSLLTVLPEQGMGAAAVALALLLLYVCMLATPFVPGAEIGLALMIVFGTAMVLPVYVATVLGLSIAFAAGRFASGQGNAPPRGGEVPASDALAAFADGFRHRPSLQRLTRFRWLFVAALINMPGNSVIGGGGGIAMAIGYSRAFPYPAFLACVALAVAPVPALILIAEAVGFGDRLTDWIESFI